MEMKPRSAPEKGAFVPPSRSRIAGTEPAPTKTSRAVPTASANRRCAAEKDSITDLLPARGGGGREPSPRIPRASSLGNDIRHYRTPFGERTTSHMSCQGTRPNLARCAKQVRAVGRVEALRRRHDGLACAGRRARDDGVVRGLELSAVLQDARDPLAEL